MTTDAGFTASKTSAASSGPLIDTAPHESTEPGWSAGSHLTAANAAGDVRQTLSPPPAERACRVVEPVIELHAWLTDVPDQAVLLIYRALLDCLSPS